MLYVCRKDEEWQALIRPVPTHVLMFHGLCVCLLVITVSPAEVDEPMEMPFGGQTHVGSKNSVFDGVHIDTAWQIRRIDVCISGDAAGRYRYCSSLC